MIEYFIFNRTRHVFVGCMRWQKLMFTMVFALLVSCFGYAQAVNEYIFSQSSTVYTPIVGGTNMELLGTATGPFDGQFFHAGTGGLNGTTTAGTYNALPIGFDFVYNNETFNGFFMSNNGWIKLGSTSGTAIGSGGTIPISSTVANSNNIISAFGLDIRGSFAGAANRTSGSEIITLTGTSTPVADLLVPGMRAIGTGIPAGTTIVSVDGVDITLSNAATSNGTGTIVSFVQQDNLSYVTTGTPGSRVLTVQWKNVQRWSSHGDNLNFQIKLYEGTNKIEIIYDCKATTTITLSNTVQVGLKGNLSPNVFNNRTGVDATAWSNSTAGTAANSTLPFRGPAATAGEVTPVTGLVYEWTAPSCLTPSGLSVTNLCESRVKS